MLRDIMDLHAVSVKYTDYRKNHCIMIAWIEENEESIVKGLITYEDYVTKAKTLGIEYYIEKSFNLHMTQQFAIKRYTATEVVYQFPKGTKVSGPKEQEKSVEEYVKKTYKNIFIL